MRFTAESVIKASAERVFQFHEEPDAFERLQPPWQKSEVIEPPNSLAVGTRVVLRVKIGPVWQRIVAEHVEYEPGYMFADRMVEGPFKSWLHRHIVTPRGPDESLLTDDVEYELPLGIVGSVFGRHVSKLALKRLFDFRHRVTREACERP